jgi:hypothetical protein
MAEITDSENRSSDDPRSSTPQERTLALVLNRDLLFGSRIRSALSALGMQGKFVKDSKQFNAELVSNSTDVAIAVIDMNGPIDWESLRKGLGATAVPPTLAFGPHVDVEGRRAAKMAGIDRIVSNGQFDREMMPLIERYRRH